MDLSFRSVKIVIRCADLNASRAFYADVLRLPVTEQWDEPEGRGVIVTLGDRAPGTLIEMYEMSAADTRFREPFPCDKIDLQLQTASLDEWADRLRGEWPFEGPQDLPWGQRWLKLRDPDGLLIAIYT